MGTEVKEIQIVPFEGNLSKYIDELVQLDAICLGVYGAAWSRENFLRDLPRKWELSKLAVSNNKLVGYIICSAYDRRGHIHRLAVNPAFQRSQIGTKLVREFARACLALRIQQITAETPLGNIMADNFYQKIGFRRLKDLQLRDYLLQKGKYEKMIHYAGHLESRAVYLVAVEQLCSIPDAIGEGVESK